VVKTTAMASSLRSCSKTARISRIVSRLKAFLFSGRLIVIFATVPRVSKIVYFPSSIMIDPFDCRACCLGE
jgi:hypothetical protein